MILNDVPKDPKVCAQLGQPQTSPCVSRRHGHSPVITRILTAMGLSWFVCTWHKQKKNWLIISFFSIVWYLFSPSTFIPRIRIDYYDHVSRVCMKFLIFAHIYKPAHTYICYGSVLHITTELSRLKITISSTLIQAAKVVIGSGEAEAKGVLRIRCKDPG